MELYYIISITDHDKGDIMNTLYRDAGLHMILSMPGRGTATSELLALSTVWMPRRRSLPARSPARRKRNSC